MVENYTILPFGFKYFDNDTSLLVNQAGEHIFLPKESFQNIF